jgi:homeobox protein cut-like
MDSSTTMTDVREALEFWKIFNLAEQKVSLEKSVTEMRELKTASINGRKKLNEMTKNFRSKPKEDQMNELTDILKAYQDEIDQLSRRSKFSESAFYGLCKSLFDATDPAITIEALIESIESSSTHHLEVERLRNELSQYEEEFQSLKNQDITIRRLEDKLSEYENNIDERVSQEIIQRTHQIEMKAEAQIEEYKEMQKVAEKRLLAAIEAMKEAQNTSEKLQTQFYELSSQTDVRISALMAENSLLAESMERHQSRCVELESMNETLKVKNSNLMQQVQMVQTSSDIKLSSSSRSSETMSERKHNYEENQTLQVMITELQNEIRLKEEFYRKEKARHDSMTKELQNQLSRERESLSKCKQELLERPVKDDLIAVRKQLRLLQRIVFNVEDDEVASL